MQRLLHVIASVLAIAATSPAAAQENWPDRPVRILIGAPPGGSTEQVVRPIAEALTARFGQQFLIDPRPGAGGNIAAEAAAKAPADGYVLLVSTIATHGIGPSLYKKLNYDAVKDFRGIAKLADFPNVIYTSKDSPFKTLADVVAYARANPDKINYGSTGIGTSLQLTAVLLAQSTGIAITHVPYKGTGQQITAVLSKEIDFGVDNLPGMLGQIKGGAVRALAISTATRSPDLPEIPTVAESGISGFAVSSWYGLSAPAGVSPIIIDKIAAEIAKIQTTPELRVRYATMGATVSSVVKSDFDSFVNGEIARWAPVVRASGANTD
jgi:tripartite-type tricarboxylate transporter receptor subunit TctC